MLLLAELVLASSWFAPQASPPPDPSAAHRAEQAGDFATAESVYRQLLLQRPDAALYQRLGLVCHMQNKFGLAADAFEHAVQLDPNLWTSHLFFGIDAYRLNAFDKAGLHLETANRLHPNETQVMFWLGATRLAHRDFLPGCDMLESLLERDPANTEALRLLAEAYANHGTSLLNEVGDHYPNSAAGLTVQGQALEFEGAFAPALECYRAALVLDPRRPGLNDSIRRLETRRNSTPSTAK